jgi:hypothetical protein
MPFNFLLVNNLLNITSWEESGTKISISPKNGEKILFFKLDDKNKPEKVQELKNALGMKSDKQTMCDLLIYYQVNESDTTNKIICLAEGKGKDIEHGVEQIKNTYTSLKNKLPTKIFNQLTWAAYIQVNQSSSLKKKKEPIQKLIDLGIKKYDIGKDDFGNFIRNN